MLGGHLDSWHAATGATDNAIGVAVMMEAARILKALGLKPRRTIRVALWGGEEQGLLGSKAYVAKHFGTAEAPTPEFATFGGYLNVDSGTGRIRGATVFGPAEAGRILREIFAPFEDLGIVGATVTKSRRTGGTDSTSFNAAGLPGIGLMQDPIEYQSLHVAHQPRHLRAHRRGRREEERGDDCVGALPPGDARRAAAALHDGGDAGAHARAVRPRPRPPTAPPTPALR